MTSSNKKNCYYPRASEPASAREIVKESYLVLGFKALSTALSHLRTRERERGRETERDRDRERQREISEFFASGSKILQARLKQTENNAKDERKGRQLYMKTIKLNFEAMFIFDFFCSL